MKKINKKSINYGLKILTILAFVLIFVPFNKALAQCGEGGCNYIYGTQGGYSNYNSNSYYNSTPYQTPIYTAPQTSTSTPIVYSNDTNPNVTSTTTAPKTIAKIKTTSPSNTVATTNSKSASSLASNVIFGSNSFLPSGLIQWILFAIFILTLIILTRRIFGVRKKYLAIPMKYE